MFGIGWYKTIKIDFENKIKNTKTRVWALNIQKVKEENFVNSNRKERKCSVRERKKIPVDNLSKITESWIR